MTIIRPAPAAQGWFARWSRFLPLAMLGLVLLLSLLLAYITSRLAHDQQRVRFEREVSAHTAALKQRITDFDQLLQATRAFWLANPLDVTPQNFEKYGEVLNLTTRYPDVQALGYVAWIPSGDAGALETLATMRGITNYKVKPATTPYSTRAPIVLLIPNNANNQLAQGFDLYTETQRRSALDRAKKTNTFQVTGRVSLVQVNQHNQRIPGFLFMLPVWRSDTALSSSTPPKQGDLTGFLYLAIRADQFLESLDKTYKIPGITSKILLANVPLSDQILAPGEFNASTPLNLGGLTWQTQYVAPASFGQDTISSIPILMVVAGLYLAGLAYMLTQAQVLAREQAEEANHNLSEAQARQERSRAEFEAIFQSMQDAAAFTDAGGRIRMVNRALNEQFGFKPTELAGQPLAILHLDSRLAGQTTFQAITTPYRRKDQTHFYGEAQRSEVRGSEILGKGAEVLGLLEVVRDVSERVQAEQALQAEERRSRGVLDGIPHILWVTNPHGEVTYMNAQHRRRLGSHDVRSRVYPQDLGIYDQMWRDARTMHTRSQCEVRLQVGGTGAMLGGSLRDRWFEVRVAPLLNDAAQVTEWVASATDIHDRLVAERLAQRNEERYRGVVEGMPQIVWLTDPQGVPTYFNRRWEEYVGRERAGQGLLPTLHPDDRAEYQVTWAQAVQRGQNFEAEHRLLGSDSIYRTFVSRGLPVRDAHGQVIEWVGTSTDVDDSVYAEYTARLLADISEKLTARVNDPLAARPEQYHAVLELLTERLMVAAALWTLPGPQLLAASHKDPNWELPHLREFIDSYLKRVIAHEETVYLKTHPLLHGVAATSALACPLVGIDGTLRGVLGVAFRQELHDRDHELVQELCKRLTTALDNDALRARANAAQMELQGMNQSLEERVQRRTLELQEANKELEAFSYSVSHDLRTPLRHIVGFGDLLKKEAQDTIGPKGNRYLTVIGDAATRMSTLIDSLLEFSRMGRQPLRTAPVDLGPLVKSAWRNLEPDCQGRHITFLLSPLPEVVGDAALLDLVFQNLLSNAIKYSCHQAQAIIEVSGHTKGDWVTITVRDNGVGFDPQYADKLFGVFQRLHRAEEFEGTGIGLANVRRIVTRHGGSVSADSVPGEGAAFHITLPLKPLEQR